jgi:HEAT repeat protein
MKILDELKLRVRAAGGSGGVADYFHILLMEGGLKTVVDLVNARPALLAELLPIVANPEASMNVRFGASAVFERFAGLPALRSLVGPLGALTRDADARVRADDCHYLGLSRSADALAFLRPLLSDPDSEVREIAADSVAEIEA